MYHGETKTFDLTDGSNCFRKTKTFTQITLFFSEVYKEEGYKEVHLPSTHWFR